MPAKTREDDRHQGDLVLTAPSQILLDIGQGIDPRQGDIAISANSPRIDHISLYNNLMQQSETIASDRILAALPPVPRHTQHHCKSLILQISYQLLAFLQGVFSVIVEPDTPYRNQRSPFVPDIRALLGELISLFQIFVVLDDHLANFAQLQARQIVHE